jgi:hypothetical protein
MRRPREITLGLNLEIRFPSKPQTWRQGSSVDASATLAVADVLSYSDHPPNGVVYLPFTTDLRLQLRSSPVIFWFEQGIS